MEFSHNVPGAATATTQMENHERHEKDEKNRPQMDTDKHRSLSVYSGCSVDGTPRMTPQPMFRNGKKMWSKKIIDADVLIAKFFCPPFFCHSTTSTADCALCL